MCTNNVEDEDRCFKFKLDVQPSHFVRRCQTFFITKFWLRTSCQTFVELSVFTAPRAQRSLESSCSGQAACAFCSSICCRDTPYLPLPIVGAYDMG